MSNLMRRLAVGLILSGAVFTTAHAENTNTGFGNDIPLQLAAKKIAPQDYTITYAEGVNADTPISWGQSSDWRSALSGALAKKGMKAEYGDNTINIVKSKSADYRPYSSTPSRDIVQKKSSTHKNRSSQHNKKQSSRKDVAVAAKPTPAPLIGGGGFVIRPYTQSADLANSSKKTALSGKEFSDAKPATKNSDNKGTFVVEEGYLLQSTLNAWAEATGWKVVWNSEHDYQIEASASFSGDFMSASKSLLDAMRDARPTINADFYTGNKVLVISNKLSDEVNN